MKRSIETGGRKLVRINVCDVALALYLCVLYAHQRENIFEMILRYGTLALVILVYAVIYGKASLNDRTKQRLGTGYYAVWASVFMVYAGLSFFWSIDGSAVISAIVNIFKPMLACFAVLPRIRTEKGIERILQVILFALVYMLLLLVIRTPFSTWGTSRVGSVINQHSNTVGRLTNFGILLSLYFLTTQKKHRNLFIVLMICFAVCALMTGSKNAIFLLIAQVSMYYFLISGTWKRLLVVICVVVGVVLLLYLVMTNEVLYNLVGVRIEGMLALVVEGDFSDGSTRERLYFMRTAQALFMERPIFGIGLDNFASYLESIFYENAKYSHSGFLELLSTLGLTGFILYYSMYIQSIVLLIKPVRRRNRLAAVLLTYTVCAFLFDISTISMYNYPSYLPLMLSFVAGRVFRTNQRKEVLYGHLAEHPDEV